MSEAGPQHLRALEYANRVRLARAELKRRVATRQTTAAQVVTEAPWESEGMEVSDLLMSQPRWGRTRCRRMLVSLGIPENKYIGTMTDRQRRALTDALEAKEEHDSESRRDQLVPA